MISWRCIPTRDLDAAHHQLDIASRLTPPLFRLQPRFVKHPLYRCVEQNGMLQIGYLPIKPKMDPGDGRMLKTLQVQRQLFGLGVSRQSRQQLAQAFKRQRQNDGVAW